MKYLRFWFFLSIGLSLIANAEAEVEVDAKELEKRELILTIMPSEPEGYSWKVFYGIGVLCPKSWDFKYPTTAEQGSCYDSKDSNFKIDNELYTVTGSGQTASQLAGQFMKEITDNKNNTVDIFDPIDDGKAVLRYKSSSDKSITHKYYIANNSSKRLHVISITASEKSWASVWKVAETVFKKVALLPMWDSI